MMEESTRLTDAPNQHHRNPEFGDDECSTDSGCSSGGSTGSAERLSRRGSGERLCEGNRSPRSHYYLDRLRAGSTATRSQERLSRRPSSNDHSRAKSSRSWSPSDSRARASGVEASSPSHSQSPSDAHSSDSDSMKRRSASNTLRKAFQSLKLSTKSEKSEKKHLKKSPKRILRSPVAYTYVRGLSGLPTQRVPRNTAHQQIIMPCTCQNSIGLYR